MPSDLSDLCAVVLSVASPAAAGSAAEGTRVRKEFSPVAAAPESRPVNLALLARSRQSRLVSGFVTGFVA
jgi:hypothetical protein